MATEIEGNTPPENKRRKIHFYTYVDTDGMQDAWWKTVEREM